MSKYPPKFTDDLSSEQARQLSLRSKPLTLPLRTIKGKTHAITILDCPGHTQFHDESVTSLRTSDGMILVIDVVEGIRMHDEMLIKQCMNVEGLPMMLVINKMDRLITELKLSPEDAYCKIRHVIEDANRIIRENGGGANKPTSAKSRYPTFCPSRGNVVFASGLHGWCFSLESLSTLYVDFVEEDDYDSDEEGMYDNTFGRGVLGKNLSIDELSKRLWGETYLDPTSRSFHKRIKDCPSVKDKSSSSLPQRTFVEYVLEPIYKIYTACLGEEESEVNKVLRSVGVHLAKDQLRSSANVLLKAAFEKLMGDASGFVDMIVKNVPSPAVAAPGKVARCYSGPLNSKIAKSMLNCNPNGQLIIHVVKLYSKSINSESTPAPSAADDEEEAGEKSGGGYQHSFSAFGRIYSGSVRPGDKVKVLGEAYTPDDDEDVALATVEAVAIPRGRFRTEVSVATAGNWVLLDGIDASIAKTATIVGMNKDEDDDDEEDVHIFTPVKFPQAGGEAVMKLSVEPLNPAELPKMVEGLRRISKTYAMARTRVEESGEHILFGTGELYLDCAMHDLRHVYSDIEVKVADPVVGFRETVVETSSITCFAETTNKKNKLTMIAEPLDEGLAEKLEGGKIDHLNWDSKKTGRFFQTKYDWDLLSARSVWAFGDSPTHGPNILMDDTLPSEVDKSILNTCKSSIVQGFQWAMREGPLCEEPVRSTKLKIIDTVLATKPIQRGAGQIIPTARKVVHSSLLTAVPRLMEPVYRLQIQCYGEIVDSIHPILTKRRGHIVEDKPIPGSPLYSMKAFIPVMDSFGFETDLRTYTQGRAMVHSVFDHWAIVPGDPLDRSILLHPLEPSPPQQLARDFLVKTRRRKGLSEDVSLMKFFNEEMRVQLE